MPGGAAVEAPVGGAEEPSESGALIGRSVALPDGPKSELYQQRAQRPVAISASVQSSCSSAGPLPDAEYGS
jgi:hypothetical protein